VGVSYEAADAQVKKDTSCRHPDCIYRTQGENTKWWNCDYLTITRKCRTAGLSAEEAKPCNCKKYIPRSETKWEKKAQAMYNAGASDEEIAEATGKSYNTVRLWRYRKKLAKNHAGKGGEAE